jgi:protoheme IX farnesyltransferase
MPLISKPGIVSGLAVSAFAGMALASRGLPSLNVALACILCLGLAASGSAMLNALFESGTDALMPRVQRRASALARLGRKNTLALSVLLILLSVAGSYVFLNPFVSALIAAAAVSYAVLYTLYFKRRSPYGTVPGGIPGALPVLIGYAAVKPSIGMDGILLFLVMLLWQPPHFLALALKYKDEYAAAGLPVMPVALGEQYTKVFMLIYAAALPLLTLSLWALGYCSPYFAAFASAAGIAFLACCYVDVVRRRRYGRAFGASIVYIMAVLGGVVVDMSLGGSL